MHHLWPLFLLFTSFPAFASGEPLKYALSSYVNTYYLAESKLQDFDLELAKASRPGFLARAQSYRDLLALHIMLDERRQEIESFFEKLGGRAEHDDFAAHLRSLDPAERLALSDIVKELGSRSSGLPLFYSSLAEELAARSASAGLIAPSIARARHDRALARELHAAKNAIRFQAAAPPRAKIIPSQGPEGTVDGSQFPANTWALTYDDGPHAEYTPQILANLEAEKKKANFMWLAECLDKAPTLPAKALALGMSTNNHSWTHLNLSKGTAAVLAKEITAATERDGQLYGEHPRFFRLPYGAGLNSPPARKLIADNGMVHIFWNVDSLDWQDKDPKSILERVKKEMAAEKRGIILFHDIHPQSVVASDLVLKYSATLNGTPAAQRWVTLPEIVDELNRLRGRF